MSHPAITLFANELSKRTVSPTKKEEFRKFRDKLEPGSENRQLADELWAECERLGDAEVEREWRKQLAQPKKPTTTKPSTKNSFAQARRAPSFQPSSTAREVDQSPGAAPSLLGEPFHNPYTFLPFPAADWFQGKRARRAPTPITADEIDSSRLTGILELELKTLSPLMSCEAKPRSSEGGHQVYGALLSGSDVVVPATGIKGSLRTLMTILAGGTLGYLDSSIRLVQGRDLQLGPAGRTSPPSVPRCSFLARVVTPGNMTKPGSIKLGRTKLIPLKKLEPLAATAGQDLKEYRPRPGRKVQHLWIDDSWTSLSVQKDPVHPWQLKLSGRPVDPDFKREGLFLDDGSEVEIAPELWSAYLARNRHGDHRELQSGDLVWLEAKSPNVYHIAKADDIESLQWARWGRRGDHLKRLVQSHHAHVQPDSSNPDGKVDEVTDLFGQVPTVDGQVAFASRIRPENLVFFDAATKGHILRGVSLAPLAPPHPGCAAFYRDARDVDSVSNHDLPMRGYKVYRTTVERGNSAPWLFGTQGVYDDQGRVKAPTQRVNKTCDLVKEDTVGRLRIAFRSLNKRELALLLLACSVDWRLGGGKPLGLGHCRPTKISVYDELGTSICVMNREGDDPAELPAPYAEEVDDLKGRRNLWWSSQKPVQRLRYPRAVNENRHRKQRGGHVWFGRHASPKKSDVDGKPTPGLQKLWTGGELKEQLKSDHVSAQPLPKFDPSRPESDQLYGYDLFVGDSEEWSEKMRDKRTVVKKLKPFAPEQHARQADASEGTSGQNRQHRQADRAAARNRNRNGR